MLERAEAHIQEGEQHIAVGKELLARLSRLGAEVGPFATMLTLFPMDAIRNSTLRRKASHAKQSGS
jgi:hypothetical protein